jgi:hypothetical protein
MGQAGSPVKALSVMQPYASGIANGKKLIEWRTWSTSHRGPILIVSGKRGSGDGPRGVALAIVELVSCTWNEERQCYAWKLRVVRKVPQVPVTGRVRLFEVDLRSLGIPQD